jgi:hypothetical protein
VLSQKTNVGIQVSQEEIQEVVLYSVVKEQKRSFGSIDIIDKTLLLTARSIGGLILPVKEYFSSKIREGDTFWRGMRISGSHFWAAGLLFDRVTLREGIPRLRGDRL